MPHNLFHMGKYPLNRDLMDDFSKKLHTEFDQLHGKYVYGRINSATNDDGSIEKYQVSLITDYMIQQDARFIELTTSQRNELSTSDEEFLQSYHPFFFEFYGKKRSGKDILRDNPQKWKK